jgi:hypothetical protein
VRKAAVILQGLMDGFGSPGSNRNKIEHCFLLLQNFFLYLGTELVSFSFKCSYICNADALAVPPMYFICSGALETV